jgi:hypothetical protein
MTKTKESQFLLIEGDYELFSSPQAAGAAALGDDYVVFEVIGKFEPKPEVRFDEVPLE